MNGLKSLLTYFVEKYILTVVLGDNSEGVVMGVGTFECRAFKLKNVFYDKGIESNLNSISQLCDVGNKVLFN